MFMQLADAFIHSDLHCIQALFKIAITQSYTFVFYIFILDVLQISVCNAINARAGLVQDFKFLIETFF